MVELLSFSLLQWDPVWKYFSVHHKISKVYDVTKSLMHFVLLYVLIWSESDHFDSMEDFVTRNGNSLKYPF